MIFGDSTEFKLCKYCGYKMVPPYPKVCPNPNCLKSLEVKSFADNVASKSIQNTVEQIIPVPKEIVKDTSHIKQIEISKNTAARKIKGVRVKKKKAGTSVDLNANVIVLPLSGQYFKNFGIVTEARTILYNKNIEFNYLHELSCNLDFIASSIMGGEIDRLILQSDISEALEKILYVKSNGIIFFIYGVFPDKQGNWILKQMIKASRESLIGIDLTNITKLQLAEFKRKFQIKIKFIMQQYMKMENVLTKKEIPFVGEELRFDYFGMSYRSIGTISKLLTNKLPIEMNMPGMSESQIDDLKESLITAKIEAIAANTIANTQATPIYLSVKLGYDRYRYLLFEKLKNDYFVYMLVEGNLKKYGPIKKELLKLVEPVTDKPFKGDLKPFTELKQKVITFFKNREI